MSEEHLDSEYLKKRIEHEKRIDKVTKLKNNSIQTIEDVENESIYYLKKFTENSNGLLEGKKELNKMKNNIHDKYEKDVKVIKQSMEDYEVEYRRKKKILINDKVGEK